MSPRTDIYCWSITIKILTVFFNQCVSTLTLSVKLSITSYYPACPHPLCILLVKYCLPPASARLGLFHGLGFVPLTANMRSFVVMLLIYHFFLTFVEECIRVFLNSLIFITLNIGYSLKDLEVYNKTRKYTLYSIQS